MVHKRKVTLVFTTNASSISVNNILNRCVKHLLEVAENDDINWTISKNN